MTRPDRPPWLEAEIVELIRAAEPFSLLHEIGYEPDDGYHEVGPTRVTFGQIRRLRSAIAALRDEWRS